MSYQDKDEPVPLKTQTTTGEYYLKGFSDGYYNRPQKKLRSKQAREAYSKGYEHGRKSTDRTRNQ